MPSLHFLLVASCLQCWSVSPVLNALYLQLHPLFRCFTVHIFSCAAPAFWRLLSRHFQCCTWSLLPETKCRHLSWSLDQPSYLLFASKCSNSEPAGPGQNACPSSSPVGSSKRVTISFSRYYLLTRPFTGAINCLQSWCRHRSSSSSWYPRRRSLAVASSREVERRRTGQIWLAYQLPMCAAVHLRPSLPKNNSENVWELEAFEL